MNGMALRRVQVDVLVKATSDREAENMVTRRMNDWFLDPTLADLEPDAGYPAGALLHYTVRPVTGHRSVAA